MDEYLTVSKEEVRVLVSVFFWTMERLSEEEDGDMKRARFISALETIFKTHEFYEGCKLLPHQTFEDGRTVQAFCEIFRFLARIGSLDDD